jgi:serpin B
MPTQSNVALFTCQHTSQSQVHAVFGRLQRQLGGARKGTELDLANGLWAQEGHPFVPAFLDVAREGYDATVKQVDFRVAADAAGRDINSWVRDRTKGKLRSTIPPGVLDADTRLVLVNAIYFKGTWKTKFNSSQTAEEEFFLDESRTVKCQMMHCFGRFRSSRACPDCKLIELPYEGNAFSMIVLLPIERESLERLESKLTVQNLALWLASVQEPGEAAHVFLPRFKFQSEFSLKRPLVDLGMIDAFGMGADFSGMDGTTDRYISAVLHQAFVEVDEEGTKAGAATISHVGTKGMSPVFRADHPFLFLIRHNPSGSILFLGHVADPTQS